MTWSTKWTYTLWCIRCGEAFPGAPNPRAKLCPECLPPSSHDWLNGDGLVCYGRVARYKARQALGEILLLRQGGRCAICGIGLTFNSKQRSAVDHKHSDAVDEDYVRSVICIQCNLAIGFIELAMQRGESYWEQIMHKDDHYLNLAVELTTEEIESFFGEKP